jgi:hypothetical protein
MAPVYDLSDESLLRYYNSVRGQIEVDDATNFRLIGPAAREWANELIAEIRRRRLKAEPF